MVHFYGITSDGQRIYLVTEYCDLSLQALLYGGGNFNFNRVVELFARGRLTASRRTERRRARKAAAEAAAGVGTSADGRSNFNFNTTHLHAPVVSWTAWEVLASELALQLCRAVRYIHACGYSHGDLKPDNILLNINIR